MRRAPIAIAALACLFGSRAARADVGIGLFVGEPLGLDLKLDLQPRSALDLVIGATTIDRGRESYAHVTYLYTLAVARGNAVVVPLRLGIGGAVYGFTERDRLGLAARVPFELGLRFRRSPIEIYGEITFVLQLAREGARDPIDPDVDGGVGLRVYF